MSVDELKYMQFFEFCEGLISSRFKQSWFGGHVDKDDLIQETALHFWRRRKGIDLSDPRKQAGLIVTVARAKLYDWLRREGRKELLGGQEGEIRSRWRSLSSQLNVREQFDLFASTLSPKELEFFGLVAAFQPYTRGDRVRPLLTRDRARVLQFYDNPSPSIIGELSEQLGITRDAAAQRLSRIRRKYRKFVDAMNNGGRVVPYADGMMAELKARGLCDEHGWAPVEECAGAIGLPAEEIIGRCRSGAIDAYPDGDRWWISPAAMKRWFCRGDLRRRGYEDAMYSLKKGGCMRRAAWDYFRGLSGELWASEGKIIDCYYQARDRSGAYPLKIYRPTAEDRAAADWVKYYRGGYTPWDERPGPPVPAGEDFERAGA